MKVSVALCSYNGERYILEQLGSIEEQTRLPDELIIVDDGSSDNSVKLINEFIQNTKIRTILKVNDNNLGVTRNFEKAIMSCSGDIIALSDQDDIWLPHKLEMLIGIFEKEPHVGMVFSDAEIVDDSLNSLGYRVSSQSRLYPQMKTLINSGRGFDVFLRYNVATGCTLAFKSSCRKFLLPFAPEWHHDAWIALILSVFVPIRYINNPLLLYRQHANNVIGGKRATVRKLYECGKKWEFEIFKTIGKQFEIVHQHLMKQDSPDQQMIEKIQYKINHLNFRSNLNKARIKRIFPIVCEAFSGQYFRFSGGLRSIIRDLVV